MARPDGAPAETPGDPPGPPQLNPAYYEQILNSLTSGVITLDRQGVIASANYAAAAHLGVSAACLQPGERLDTLPVAQPFVEMVREVEAAKAPLLRRELILTLESGRRKEIGLNASPLEGPFDYNGVIILFTDLTELHNLERAAQLNRQLATIGEMTARVVHELRNPVTIIQATAELMQGRLAEDEKMHSYASAILQETHHLETLIRQFLGFSKPFELEATELDPKVLLDRVAVLCKAPAQEKRVKLDMRAAPELPCIRADRDKAARAIANIVNNAIDAVPEKTGEVVLRTYAENECLVVEVTDNGPGIQLKPDEDLFRPFFSKKKGGTGLGLAIVHRIVTAHNGSINFSNRLEGGACFEIRLPIASST